MVCLEFLSGRPSPHLGTPRRDLAALCSEGGAMVMGLPRERLVHLLHLLRQEFETAADALEGGLAARCVKQVLTMRILWISFCW